MNLTPNGTNAPAEGFLWRPIGKVLVASSCLAIACRPASARSPAARPLNIKEAVQLALRQNPQRLSASLAVSDRKEGQTIAHCCLRPDSRRGKA